MKSRVCAWGKHKTTGKREGRTVMCVMGGGLDGDRGGVRTSDLAKGKRRNDDRFSNLRAG